jgi:hypothetical protein
MKQTTGFINISNTTQGTISLNCSYREGDTVVSRFYDVLPARECITGCKVPIEDWNRIKDSPAIVGLIDDGKLLPDKKKVTIDQETRAVSDPKPSGELAEHTLGNLAKGGTAKVKQGGRVAKTTLKDA